MITVKVLKISYHSPSRSYSILLKEVDGDDCISFSVGSFEAQSIALAMESIKEKRPTTHDLICHLLSEIGFSLKRVRITESKDGIFYAVIDLKSKKYGSYNIDSRPSDAIAISLRENVPILVSEKLIKNTNVHRNSFSRLDNNINSQNIIDKLKISLKNAVKNEKYEIAAEIRDKIKKIES